MLRVTLKRGDILKTPTQALITSANDSLVGNGQPTYWRFVSRVNVDGALRKLAGPELEQACLAIEPLPATLSSGIRRDLTRWTSGVKHGPSKVVRCPAGAAVSTPAFGAVLADHVVHAVVPDSEFGYEGQYTGGERDHVMSGVVEADTQAIKLRGLPHFTPPDNVLFSTYRSAFAETVRLGATDVACPALGTGVKGWKPAISAALALEVAARLAAAAAEGTTTPSPSHVTFVVGGPSSWSDGVWKGWCKAAATLLGEPTATSGPVDSITDAQRRGIPMSWDLDGKHLGRRRWDAWRNPLDEGGALLSLRELDDLAELLLNRQRGYHGKDEPLTAEQELAATRRRSTR
jgi:O-acetyl-ADP-ribose deacetylase (regulator of RNase III)